MCRINYLLLICLIVFLQCKEDPEQSLRLSTSEHSITLTCADCSSEGLPYSQGSLTLKVVSTTENWRATENISWLEIIKFGGDSIRVNYEANPTIEQRTGEVTASIEDKNVSVSIVQQGALALTLSSRQVNVPLEAGDTTLNITSVAGAWEATETPEMNWLSVQKMGEDALTISYLKNTLSNARIATIKISVPNTQHAESISFTQMSNIALSSTEVRVTHKAGDTTLMITSAAGEWQATEESDMSWLSMQKVDNDKLIINFQVNPTPQARTATIQVKVPNTNISESITFIQFSRLNISKKKIEVWFPAHTTPVTIDLKGGVWQATEAPEVTWLSLEKVSERTLNISYQENTTNEQRSATIEVSVEGTSITETISVTQDSRINVQNNAFKYVSSPIHVNYEADELILHVFVGILERWQVKSTTGNWINGISRESNTQLSIDYPENNTGIPREVTLVLEIVQDPTKTRTLTIRQNFKPIFTIPPPIFTNHLAGDTTITVTVNTGSWSIRDAIGLVTEKIGEDKLKITYPVVAINLAITRHIRVISTEAPSVYADIRLERTTPAELSIFSSSDIRVGFVSGDTTVRLTSVVGTWTAEEEPAADWMSLQKVSETELKITYTAPPADQQNTRQTHIKISAGQYSGFLRLTQNCFGIEFNQTTLLTTNGRHIVPIYADDYSFFYYARIKKDAGIVEYSVDVENNFLNAVPSYDAMNSLESVFMDFTPNLQSATSREARVIFTLTVNGSAKCTNEMNVLQPGWGIKIDGKLPTLRNNYAAFCANSDTATGTHTFTITQEEGSAWNVKRPRYFDSEGLVSYTKTTNSLSLTYDMSQGPVLMDIIVDHRFVSAAVLIDAAKGDETCMTP